MAKKGEPPLDGKTDTDPEGLSAVNAGGRGPLETHFQQLEATVEEPRLTAHDVKVSFIFDILVSWTR